MTLPVYLQISPRINSRDRLAWLKRDAVKHNEKVAERGYGTPYKTWRERRYSGFHNAHANFGTLSQGFDGADERNRHAVWYTYCGPEFRDERYCDEIARSIGHNGWFAGSDCYETVRGIVARLPHGRFIAGYVQSVNSERTYYPEIFDDERDAALMADEHARVIAETAREFDDRLNAARDLENDTEIKLHRLRECIALRHRECMSYVRVEIGQLIETIRANRARLAGEFADVL